MYGAKTLGGQSDPAAVVIEAHATAMAAIWLTTKF